MKTYSTQRTPRGFSLLEVLIAVVILSIGLLALASLQLSLIRSSSDTKSQTVGVSLAKEKLDTLAAYSSLGGSSTTCVSPATSVTNSCYRAITNQLIPAESLGTIGGVSYTRRTNVTRYVYAKASSGFITLGNTLTDAQIKAACATCLTGKEFKRAIVTVSWTDAGGTTRSVAVDGAIPALDPSDTMTVSTSTTSTAPRKAISIISNPAATAGVIPIAIGNGSDTAATNPRPVIVGQGNNFQTVETRFDIYTYAAIAGGNTATAQSRVETSVVGCKCTYGTGTQTSYRPTYWDGFEYKAPVTVTGTPVSAQANNVTQSDLCTACCRDHHDPAGVAAPLFDPRRTSHNHYLATDLTTAISTPNTPGTAGTSYNEACRLIRVDGTFRVAAEPYDDHYGLLATAGLGGASPTTTIANAVPATGAGSTTENYQTFVLNYLNTRFVTGTTYNTELDPTSVSGYSALQTPANASIASTSTPQYMHTRGLYIDYLHTDAIAAIASAKAACLASGCTTQETKTAVLKLLPFTSVNTTELAKWLSATTQISVSQLTDLKESIDLALPASGKATLNNSNAANILATTSLQRTSAGLAVLINKQVFPDGELTNNALSDTQNFTVSGAGGGGGFPGNETFTTTLAGTDIVAAIAGGTIPNLYFGPSNKSCTTSPTPYTCTTDTTFGLGGSIQIKISNYNSSGSKTVQNSCTRPNPASNLNDTIAMPYVINFDVSSVDLNGTALSPQPTLTVDHPNLSGVSGTGESTTFTVNPVAAGDIVRANFSNKSYKCPSNWSTFLDTSGDDGAKTPDNSNSSTVCVGPGHKNPAWDTTNPFIDCWATFAP